MDVHIMPRVATLDDTRVITELYQSNVNRWQRFTKDGQVEDVDYADLTVYERWLHGGPWLSVETCAVHLNHQLLHNVEVVVAELGGVVRGYAEYFYGLEPEPFGEHVHLGALQIHADYRGKNIDTALVARLVSAIEKRKLRRACLSADIVQNYFLEGDAPFKVLGNVQRMAWPVRTGQVVYQTTPHLSGDPAQIRGWSMPLGREQSAYQEWIARWPQLWTAVPELRDRRIERLKFNMAGATAFVMFAESPYDPRRASVYMWTKTPLAGPMMTAINDKAHKLGFRWLDALISVKQTALLGPDAESEGPPQEIFSLEL